MQAYEIKQLKRKVRSNIKKTGSEENSLSVDQIKLIAAHEVLQHYENVKPECRQLLRDISQIILGRDLILKTAFIPSLCAMVRKHATTKIVEPKTTGVLTESLLGQLDMIKQEMQMVQFKGKEGY